MQDFFALHGSNIGLGQGNYRDGFSFTGNKFDLERFTIRITMHNRPHIAAFKAMFFQVMG